VEVVASLGISKGHRPSLPLRLAVDAVNTFRVSAGSFRLLSRRFASRDSTFPQVSAINVPDSIPGSSTNHFGLVGHVVPTGQSLEKACEIAARIVANGPLAVRNAKASILSSGWNDDEDARKIEQRFVIEVMGSEDAREGLAAFAAKREPRFTGK
jgi:Enoyl-CoA hydratase/isomerase